MIFTQLKKIQTSIENLIKNLAPTRLSKSKFHFSWITKDVRKQMILRDKLYVKAIRYFPQDWKGFRDTRSKMKQNIRLSHHTYISELVAAIDLNDSSKSFWSYIIFALSGNWHAYS